MLKSISSAKCKDCIHRTNKDGIRYCEKEHFFPNAEVIRFYGCSHYKSETINLFNQGKEESDEEKN